MNLTFFERQGELYRRFTERHIQRAHGTDELLKALCRAGFDAEAYDFETMDRKARQRAGAVFRKEKAMKPLSLQRRRKGGLCFYAVHRPEPGSLRRCGS
ncbi:MAG: hypothetical protein ACLSH5_04280 [Christensenellales bacterium]